MVNLKRFASRGVTALSLLVAVPSASYVTIYNIENFTTKKDYMYNIENSDLSFLDKGILAEKARIFQEEIDKKHVTLEGLLHSNGGVNSDSDYGHEDVAYPMGDSMLETSLYLMSQVYRHNLTSNRDAEINIKRSVNGLHRLFEVTDKSGYPARFITRNGNKVNHSKVSNGNGKYSDYLWVGNTSRDQYIGLLTAYSLCYDLFDDEEIRKTIKEDVFSLASHLLDNDWNLIDQNGIKSNHGSMYHLFPANTLNVLKTAAHITKYQRFEKEYNKWASIYSFFGWPTVFDFKINLIYHNRGYNDNISMLCYYNLLRLEENEKLRSYYRKNMNRMWRRYLRGEGNSFFNFIYMSKCDNKNFDIYAVNEGLKTLEIFPVNKEDYKLIKTDSLDKRLVFNLSSLRFHKALANPLPINERAFKTTFVWQNCPYKTGSDNIDNTKYARVDYLLAYWMGRHYGFIKEGD